MGGRPSGYPCDGRTLYPKKLIVAAGRCAVGEGPPPKPLLLDWQCRKYRTLPETGGLRDQIAKDIEQMGVASSVYNAVLSWQRMFYGTGLDSMGPWLENHREDWKITQEWMKLSGWNNPQ